MAYDSTALVLVTEAPMTGKGQVWRYDSADASTVVDTTGYITDGGNRGMKVGDLVFAYNTAATSLTSHLVLTVNATTGAVDLSDGTVIGTATNSR